MALDFSDPVAKIAFYFHPVESGLGFSPGLISTGTGELYKATFEIKQKGTELYALGRTSYTTSDCTSEPAGCIPTEGSPTKCKKECVTRVLTHRPESFLVPIN